MELWIKHPTEDFIVKANSVRIFGNDCNTIFINGIDGFNYVYVTPQRAKEVFNEIFSLLKQRNNNFLAFYNIEPKSKEKMEEILKKGYTFIYDINNSNSKVEALPLSDVVVYELPKE